MKFKLAGRPGGLSVMENGFSFFEICR